MLKMLRLEFNDSGGAETVGLLSAGHERLSKEAADCFATIKAQVAWARGERENLLWIRRAEPMEIDGQLRGVEILAGRSSRKWVSRKRGRRCFEGGNSVAIQRAQPIVRTPHHFLN